MNVSNRAICPSDVARLQTCLASPQRGQGKASRHFRAWRKKRQKKKGGNVLQKH